MAGLNSTAEAAGVAPNQQLQNSVRQGEFSRDFWSVWDKQQRPPSPYPRMG
jgi:hypothetical protein